MITQFPYDTLDVKSNSRVKEMIEDFQNYQAHDELYGLRYYPEVFEYCYQTLSNHIEVNSRRISDYGSWMVFLPDLIHHDLDKLMMEFITSDSKKKDILDYKIISIMKQNKLLLIVKIRPFHNFEFVSYVLERIKEILIPVISKLEVSYLTFFFKPEILQITKSERSRSFPNYILKTNVSIE